MDTLQKIKELAAAQFGTTADAIDDSAPLDQLGIDSLGFLEFLFELEDKFNIAIPQDAVANVKTLKALADVVDGLLAAPAAAPPQSP